MQQEQVIELRGGMDLISTAVRKDPGSVLNSRNYEPTVDGYARIEGFEQYDGQPKPSDQKNNTYTLNFDSGSTQIMEGDTVTGDTSGATGIALADVTADTGSYGGGDATGTVTLWAVSGTFQDNEGLEVSASNVATADGAATQVTTAATLQSAEEAARTAVSGPTGSGPNLGCIEDENGIIHTFRANAGGTTGVMYRATSSGWSAVALHDTLAFSAGTTDFVLDETITGGTSGATGLIKATVVQSGSFAANDAAGYFVLDVTSGTFQNGEALSGSGSGAATSAGANAAITLPTTGYYRSITHTFFGPTYDNPKRTYIVNGAGYAFEYIGALELMIPIMVNGLTSSQDMPVHVGVQKNHLLLGYSNGSIMVSATGEPTSFDSTLGAAELNFSDALLGMLSGVRSSTILMGQNKIGYLVGNDATDFELQEITTKTGGKFNTLVQADNAYYIDDIGLRSLESTQAYGDWNIGTLTEKIEPYLRKREAAGVSILGCLAISEKNQIRIIYSDSTIITVYMGRNGYEALIQDYNRTITWVGTTQGNEDGVRRYWMGLANGQLHQIDAGTNFNGNPITAQIVLPYAHQGAPNQDKRYHRAVMTVANANPAMTLYHAANFDNGRDLAPDMPETTHALAETTDTLNVNTWDVYATGNPTEAEAFVELNGIGRNVSNSIEHIATYEAPHVLTTLTIFYSPRRKRR